MQRVVAAVVQRGESLLVCKRPAHKHHGGFWEFPGGKCEAGEPDAVALARELSEELGLDAVTIGDLLFEVADEQSRFCIAFYEVATDGDPVASEHDAIAWASPSELHTLPLAPVDRRFIELRSSQAKAPPSSWC